MPLEKGLNDPQYVPLHDHFLKVHKTGGNRSGLGRYQTDPNSKFKFEFKKMKNFQKIPKNTSRCDESNGVKFSQKFVHLE